jgi:hypothetical protein
MFENLKKLATEKNLKIGGAILVLVIVIVVLNKMGLYEGMTGQASSDATKADATKADATGKADATKAEAPKAETGPIKSTDKKITLSLS